MGRPFCGRINRPANWPSPGKKKGGKEGEILAHFRRHTQGGVGASAKTFLGGRGKGWWGDGDGGGGENCGYTFTSLPPQPPTSQAPKGEGGRLAAAETCLFGSVGWLVALSTSTDEGEREDFLLLKGK